MFNHKHILPKPEIKHFFHSLAHSYQLFWHHVLHLPKLFLIDVLFFMSFAFVYSYFSLKIIDKLVFIQQSVSKIGIDPAAIETLDAATVSAIAAQKVILLQYFKEILILVALLTLSFYILWVIFQSISWHQLHKIIHNKKDLSFWEYMRKFSIMTLIWLALALIFTYFIIKIAATNAASGLPFFHTPSTFMFSVMLSLIAYFALTSYYLAGHHSLKDILKKTFILPFTKGHHLLPAFLLFLFKVYVITKLAQMLNLPYVWTIIVGVSLFMLAFIWAKIFFVGVIHEIIDVDVEERHEESQDKWLKKHNKELLKKDINKLTKSKKVVKKKVKSKAKKS